MQTRHLTTLQTNLLLCDMTSSYIKLTNLGLLRPVHLTASISSARAESSMSRKTSTSVFQFTGCLPFSVSHSWMISVLILLASFKCLWAIIFTLDPVLSSRRKALNLTYLVSISTGTLSTLPSVHMNFSSSGRVGLVPRGGVLASGDNKHT